MANPENKQIPYESTQKDIRDAIESVATAIGGIAIPSADHVSYDNSGSGLSATDVQNALDEIVSDIPTVNDGTLTIQKNGTTVATFSANASSNASANITVPTTTSELTNNSDFVSDASYVHTDNNFTTAEKTKLGGIESGAEVNVQSDWNEADNTKDDYIKNKPSSEVKSATDTFTTVNGGLLEECIINLVPVQSGSGDPSPDNVRPISGHTEVDLQRDGKNLLPNVYTGTIDNTTGEESTGSNGITPFIPVKPNTSYTISQMETTNYDVRVFEYDSSKAFIRSTNYAVGTDTYKSFSVGSTTSYIRFKASSGKLNPTTPNKYQVEQGSTATPYEPYLGHLYQVQIGSTVYGGYVDLVSGNGTDGYSEIASYNGETINEPWISDRDAYVPNTSPSIGAQVVYPKTTATAISITPTPIEALVGQNNLSTPLDGQSIDSVKYREVFAFDDVEKVVSLRVPISMLGTDESGRTTASQSYASGDYFYKDGYMCKALTSISAGATLTLNTNYEYSTLDEILESKVDKSDIYANAGSHNSIYRGKYLGSSVTAEQWSAIQNGIFDDLFIGDYWTINGVNWRIAHFDYWLNTGDTNCTDHHIVIVPDTNLYNAKMNTNNDTTGGYYNSEMRGGANYLISGSSNLYTAKTKVDSAFGSAHILTHREILTNAVSSGNSSGCAWYDSSVDLMSEVMVYGTLAWSNGGKGYEVGDGKSQFAMFRHDISKATNRATWWLRGVSSATAFAFVSYGDVAYGGASTSRGVRPAFAIK